MKYFLHSTLFIILSLFISMGGMWGCGPMNGTPPADTNTTRAIPSENNMNGPTSWQPSKNNQFLIFISNMTVGSSASPESSLGDNLYVIHCTQTDLNLSHLSSDAELSISYEMPDMPQMGKETVVASHNPDGTFSASLFYSMSGVWKISLTIKNQLIKDTYVFTKAVQ